jgi:uncharacterized BrkB/YihY/UPF0761 family membrane protein
MFHSLWRWVVVVVALIALVKFALGWLQKKNPDALDRRLLLAFTTSIDIQVLLGIVLVVLLAVTAPVFPRAALEHTVIMVVAAVVAHLSAMWRKREDNTFLRNNFLIVLVTLALIIVGVATVNGWRF